MMNKYFLAFSFLAICLILYIKLSNFYNIIEGARNCDPNKPKVYNRGSRSAKTCQKLKENESEDNLKEFKRKLNEVKKILEQVKNNYNEIIIKQKENTSNIEKAIDSLDCKETGSGSNYKLDCSQNKDESEEEDDDRGDEVDVDAKSSSAARDASKHSGKKFQF